MNEHLPYEQQDIIQRFKDGEQAAFSAIYKQYYQRVLYFSMRYVSETNAQDITAESFVQLWEKRKDFDDMAAMVQFLFVSARNRCLNIIRHEQVRSHHETAIMEHLQKTGHATLDVEVIRLELIKLLQKEVDKLPEKTREVFMLSFQEGLKPLQIAERLGVSVKTVSNQKVTAIKLLRAAVAKHPLEAVLLALLQSYCQFS
ncbi:MAG TPA: RNA polymerase sigma-70 factor [Niastella sp.]|nr:RNA polymerase sigma-70 factor [Niastella sp.]